jgi:hypothetical protein
MGIKQDIENSLKDHFVTKIDGQPTDEDVTNLIRELSEMLASVPTTNGGGSHGHIGMIIDDAEYRTFSTGGAPFNVPTNPGPYPATVDPDPAIRERQVAEVKPKKTSLRLTLGSSMQLECTSSALLIPNGSKLSEAQLLVLRT